MPPIDYLYLVLLLACILLSAFFSSTETAFISLQRIRIKHLERSGVAHADRVTEMIAKPERLLTTILVGNNLVNTAAATLGTAILVSLFGVARGVIIATVVVTLLLLIFGEISPKVLASRHSERLALLYARPVQALMWLLSPVVFVFQGLTAQLTKLIGGEPPPSPMITEEEIRTMIHVGEEEGVVAEAEAELLHRVFEFGDHPVKEAMIPRPDIVWVERGINLKEFLQIFARHTHSRFPVYEENTDNVVGVLSTKDVLRAQAKEDIHDDSPLDNLLRPAIFVPDTKRIGELFAEMQASGNQMAMVVDEFGSVDGLVTMEQLLEELVGQVGDELAWGGREFTAIDEYTFEVDGGMRVDEANEELSLALPQGDYETVAGFVLHTLGHIPKEGEQIKQDKLRLIVTQMRGRRIEKLRVIKEKD